jgi:hypothetical protein
MKSSLNRREFVTEGLSIPIRFLLHHRGIVKLFLHLGIFLIAYHLAYLIRFEFIIPPEYGRVIRETILYLLIAKALRAFPGLVALRVHKRHSPDYGRMYRWVGGFRGGGHFLS